jgi:hypothetical protein
LPAPPDVSTSLEKKRGAVDEVSSTATSDGKTSPSQQPNKKQKSDVGDVGDEDQTQRPSEEGESQSPHDGQGNINEETPLRQT